MVMGLEKPTSKVLPCTTMDRDIAWFDCGIEKVLTGSRCWNETMREPGEGPRVEERVEKSENRMKRKASTEANDGWTPKGLGVHCWIGTGRGQMLTTWD